MKKTAKKPNRSTKKKKKEKAESPWLSIKNILAWSDHDASLKRVDWLGEKLIEWVQKKDSLSIVAFCSSLGVPYGSFIRLANNNPKLKKLYKISREIIGERREKLALYKDQGVNPGIVLHTIREYHPIYRKVYEEEKQHQKELKHNTEENNRPVNVYMDGVKLTKEKE